MTKEYKQVMKKKIVFTIWYNTCQFNLLIFPVCYSWIPTPGYPFLGEGSEFLQAAHPMMRKFSRNISP